MNKLNKLFAILFAMLGVGTLSAQTDVTSTYLTNAGFEDGTNGWTYGGSGTHYGGVLAYGSAEALNSVTNVIVDKFGKSEGNALHTSAGWGSPSFYTQEVTLSAGEYKITFDVINRNSGATKITNRFGWIPNSGDAVYSSATDIIYNAWQTISVNFTLASETTGKISVGMVSTSGVGSGAVAKLFTDNVRIFKMDEDSKATIANPIDYSDLINQSTWLYAENDGSGSNSSLTNNVNKGEWPYRMVERYRGMSGRYGKKLYQTIKVPAGVYQVQAACMSAAANGVESMADGTLNNAYFYANDIEVTYPLANATSSFQKALVILTEAGNIEFGVKTVAAGANWNAIGCATLIKVANNEDEYWTDFLGELYTTKKALVEELSAYDEDNLPDAYYAIVSSAIEKANAANTQETLSEVNEKLTNIKSVISAISNAYLIVSDKINECKTYVAADYSIVKTDDVRTTFSSAITKAETDVEEKTTADDVNAVYATLEAARQAYIVAAIPTAGNSFDMTFKMTNPQVTSASGWTNGGTATNQQYTGAPDNTYLDFYQVTRDMYQTLSDLPNGSYSIKAATRGHASVSVGYIYVKNGDNKITQDIHKVGNSGNDLGNGWGWTTTNSVSVVDGQLTIGFYGECGSGQWVGADNFTLYRTFDVTVVQAGLTDLKSEAQAIATASEPMDAAVEAALNSTIQATDDTTTDPVTLDNMVAALNTAIANAEASIADYVKLQKYIDMTAAFADVTAYQAKYNNGQYSSEDVETVRRELNVTRFNAASAVFTNNIEVTGWAGTMGDKTTKGQHWDGTTGDNATTYYDNNSHHGSKHSTTTSIKLPAGSYVLKAALRSNENTTLKLTVLDNVVDVEGKGDKGYGIDTNGQANFSAEGTYANDNNGRGWEWEFVKFQLAEETEVTLTVECDYNGVYGWASFSDITLWMDDATYVTVYGKERDAPLAEAKALVNTKPMGTNENTALQGAIELGEGTISTPAELNAAVDALKSAVANANAWLVAYNEAKAPLVAALERFEADYNNAENGALGYMNKSRWATAIEKAQAAAVAKDVTNSYDGFEGATAALVAALDAATVSVNEYASLKSAITEATAVCESLVNWGDAAFQRPESAREGLNTAISAAQSGYNAAEADGEEVTALVNAMVVTLNAPQDAYCITVATDGHAYVDCPIVATLGSITGNNPTGYGLAAKKENGDLLAQLYTFTQVEGNKYRISVTVEGETVYLTYGVLNGSPATWNKEQIQGNTDIAKAGEFEVVASTTTEGVFRLRNTVTGTYLDCQDDGGAIYTDDNITKDEFALTSATVSTAIKISADAKLGTCVLMFDAQLPDGLTAHVPESYDDETTVLTLKMVTDGILPAYTPCLLYAENGYEGTLTGTVTMNGYADKVTGEDGLLYGAIEAQTITEGYILQKHEDEEVARFYSVDGLEEEIPIPAGKCWLTLANGVGGTIESPAAVAFFFRGGGATKLNAVVMDKTTLDGAIYTLDGKRVNTMQRGEIYIINGQKVMVK